MNRLILFVIFILVNLLTRAQEFSETLTLEKAKNEGVAPVDYAGYLKQEKARFENKNAALERPFAGSYLKALGNNSASRTNSTSACANLDFEDANFSNWGIFIGTNVNSTMTPSNVIVDTLPYTSGQNGPNGNHVIVDSANSMEYNSPISVLSNYAGKTMVRLNDLFNNYEASILERQFIVTSNQPFLNFSYAAFLENAGHTTIDQPYINIVVFDSTGTAIPGTSLSIIASTSVNAGFTQGFVNGLNFFYKLWTPVVYNLSAYIGQQVTLQLIAADCTQGGHRGHAYVDFDCGGPLAGVANVWPGDANYDLKVDYLDLFYVGAGYGQTGSTRSSPGNSWSAAPSNNWYSNSLYQVDSKHADCDGDGAIGFSDTAAIYLNYGLTHAFKSSGVLQTTETTTAPKNIAIFPSSNNIYAGQPLVIDFSIGNNSDLIDSIYAIGFSMTYPEQFLDNNVSSLDCGASVLNNSGSGHLKLFKERAGSADLAITKNNQLNSQNVQGNIFSLNLRAATIIANDQIFNFSISNMKAITRSGVEIPLTASDYLVKFKASDATSIVSLDPGNFAVYPNPASDKIMITSSVDAKVNGCEVYSMIGESILRENLMPGASSEVNISGLAKGSYVVKIHLENGASINKCFIKL